MSLTTSIPAAACSASQFFITLDKADWLNNRNTIFGRVVGDTVYNMLRFNDLPVRSCGWEWQLGVAVTGCGRNRGPSALPAKPNPAPQPTNQLNNRVAPAPASALCPLPPGPSLPVGPPLPAVQLTPPSSSNLATPSLRNHHHPALPAGGRRGPASGPSGSPRGGGGVEPV